MKYMNFFEDIYYINLDERVDRKLLFEDQASELGMIPSRFSGIQIDESEMPSRWKRYYEEAHDKNTEEWRKSKKQTMAEIGCAYSHVEIIKTAKQRNLKNVLIFEDDCLFLDSWSVNIEQVVFEIESMKGDWDIIYFGGELPGNIHINNITDNKLIPSQGGIYCLHAYCVNARFFDNILAYDPEFCRQIDVMLVNSSAKNYVPVDIMAVQRSNLLSNITGVMTSEDNELEQKTRWNTNIIKGKL